MERVESRPGMDWADRVEVSIVRSWRAFLDGPGLRVLMLLVAVLLSLFLSYKAVSNQLTETNVLTENRVSLAAYLDGTAYKPFAYRLLTPLLVHVAQDVVHVPDIVRGLPAFAQQKVALLCAGATAEPRPTCDNIVSYMAVAYAYFFSFLMAMYALAYRLFRRPILSLLAVMLAYGGVNAVILFKLSHIYDFGNLMFITLLLLILDQRRYLLYTILLAISYTNKETMILYAGVFYAVNFRQLPALRNLGYFAVQFLLFMLIHGSIRWYFQGNQGLGHEYYLPEQISFFTEHVTMAILLFMLLSFVLGFYRFRDKNHTLRRACIVIFPWFVLFMIGGVEREIRVMFEIFPLVLILTLDSMYRMILGDRPAVIV